MINVSHGNITLITGATGLLGQAVLPALVAERETYALVRQFPHEPVHGVRYLLADLSRDWSTDLLPPRIDQVIHLAQSARFREGHEHAMDVFQVNVASTAILLDQARRRGARQFIYASSGGVYLPSDEALTEMAPLVSPMHAGLYIGSKLSGELVAQAFAAHMRIVVLRFFFIYGKGQRQSMLIPRLVSAVRERRPITLEGFDGIRINPVHVDDAAQAVLAALAQEESMTCNVAGPSTLSIRAIATMIGNLVATEPRFEVNERPRRDLVANTDLMCTRLKAPITEFAQALPSIA